MCNHLVKSFKKYFQNLETKQGTITPRVSEQIMLCLVDYKIWTLSNSVLLFCYGAKT